jgi:glucosamine--fructose-6-phosphate aminotransferase (isomerizing)
LSNDDATRKANGAQTEAEILSQPMCWEASLDGLERTGKLNDLARQFVGIEEWVFVGCGSSYYVALSAASTMANLTGLRAHALPASELLFSPQQLRASKAIAAVLISRSGRTSEVLRVAEQLSKRGIPTLGISCTPDQTLETLVTSAVVLTAADEQSTVMTRSFTSMLLALQALAATIAGANDLLLAQRDIAAGAQGALVRLPGAIRDFVRSNSFDDYVFLAQGALYGIACESALKLTEMSISYAQNFHTLEFRHGPKSVVSEKTLIGFLLSETSYAEELSVLEEVKRLGGTTLVVTNHADARTRAAADLLFDLDSDVPEVARVPLFLLPGQLMGLYTGLKKGFDPDAPRNLSRVVVLDDEDSREETNHAAL